MWFSLRRIGDLLSWLVGSKGVRGSFCADPVPRVDGAHGGDDPRREEDASGAFHIPRFAARLGLDSAGLLRIQRTVARVEGHTDGEVALALIKESDSYSVYELFFALVLAGACFCVQLSMVSVLEQAFARFFWAPPSWYMPAFMVASSVAACVLFFFIANIPWVDRALVPGPLKQQKSYARAVRHFVESGVCNTRNRTGILIFISVLERRVLVLADVGVSAYVPAREWTELCQIITAGLRSRRAADALCEALTRVEQVLATRMPPQKKSSNELPDGLVILSH
ncbi:hypothetical protein TPADAL_0570 [Treponema pallidum subsp. pallidum DAL-1]|uniref:TPM domain-containing protein n=4 Tax=Treponema pallidum TaxID=160 RepID=O83580_TREPA|nr:TPM domain-containing protein [Treponema pallidum]AAC65549.1 predicted coding region TP0570 [Treponema pallidum subsp. pallidum str. Nichols]ADD72681.1 conserved hypothetical protein [Treponema pallidum subsp. pallidum str. Chicago]AEZ57697.1 hypothetical protein TPESAMD_0570 [Treponema pallidum subsp. pertenue str. SamoaD]AEZ58766.1 hypothetical protein TPECDC2_0570 [Treponema pallidum subsp. pertenue str. CDC2]AEZ59834.1 hypothetical protein TPEGAU_0570 [Treponema pallidum subsp. pertenue